MTSRLIALRRGKTGDVQNFSLAREANPSKIVLVQDTLRESINAQRRQQILSDPTTCFQFACRWNDSFGFFTRPTIVTLPGDAGDTVVCGSFSDTLGRVYPAQVALADFQGYFTTLIPRGEAERFHLSMHHQEPGTIPGPPAAGGGRRAAPVEASIERLGFVVPDEPADEDMPVIVALPLFLPVGPGQTFPHPLTFTSPSTFRDTFPLFETWKEGMKFAIAHNGGRSVLAGGPLFHQPAIVNPVNQPPSFGGYSLRDAIPLQPTALAPTAPEFAAVVASLDDWADEIWIEMGSRAAPDDPPPAVAGGLGAEQITALVEPLIRREKTFRLAERTRARYRILLASLPIEGAVNPGVVTLPQLCPEFEAYLSQSIGAAAADDLRELVRQKLTIANASGQSWDKDVTLEADNITLAFSDRIRTFAWLTDSLRISSWTAAQNSLGLVQFLTPDRDGLAAVANGDSQVKSLVMANTTSSSAQLDASKSSKMYCAGRLSTFRHSYEAVCNFRLLLSAMVEDLNSPILLVKLREYTELLVDFHGRTFFDVSRDHPHLAIHPYQDLQHILSAFLKVATGADIYTRVMEGGGVTVDSFAIAIAVADGAISDLRAILHGNGLGKFQNIPCCAPWFATRHGPAGPTQRERGPSTREEPKRQRLDPADVERKKAMGIITFDAQAAGASAPPNAPVYAKKRNGRGNERICMNFLTRGFYCPAKDCKFPHVTNVNALPEAERKKLVTFVKNQPGLAWVEGKAPAGTT